MDSKKILIDFSPKSKSKIENKKIQMEKERKKRVITTTNQWIQSETTPEQELDIIRELQQSYVNATSEKINHKLVLQQLMNKINGYRAQDLEKDKYCEEKFVCIKNVLELLVVCVNICYYCKKPVKILYDFVREPRQWTLDRIDNDYGHNHDNVMIACLQCNLRRKTMYHERYMFTKQLVVTKTS